MKLFSRSRAGRSGRTSGPINPFVRPENRPTDLRLVDRFQFLPRAVRAFLTRHSVIMWCIVGCDPDVGGALAVITGHDVGCVNTVRIFNCPTQTVMVNRRPRKRVCVDGMVALVRELDLPAGTVAHHRRRRSVDAPHARPPASHARRRLDQRSCVLRPRARPIVTRRSCARKRNQDDQDDQDRRPDGRIIFRLKRSTCCT